jgi:hypothetical protein
MSTVVGDGGTEDGVVGSTVASNKSGVFGRNDGHGWLSCRNARWQRGVRGDRSQCERCVWSAGDQTFSFLGVDFGLPEVSRVRITSGNSVRS